MSFVPAIRDYIDLLNNVYDSVLNEFTLQHFLQQSFIYVLSTLKYICLYIFSFQWLRDLCYLPVIVPHYCLSIFQENFFLENPITNFFTFLETPIYGTNKFLIGFLNSIFLSLPLSAAHLISIRRLFIQGIPAGIFSGLGTISGQSAFLFCVLFGWRFFIIPWFSFEPLSYIIGIFLVLTIVYEMAHQRALKILDISEKSTLTKIFFLNFALSWTEQTALFQYFGNLTFSAEPTLLETTSASTEFQFLLIHGSYLLGIVFGSLFFTSFFGFLCIRFSEFLLKLSSLTYSRWINKVNNFLLVSIMAFTFTSLPFYGLDYLLANQFGFVSQDTLFDKTFFSSGTIADTNQMLGENSFYALLDTEVTPFDRAKYLRLETGDSFEELNYQGEYAWTARQDRRANYRNDRFRKVISNFFQKTNFFTLGTQLSPDSKNKDGLPLTQETKKFTQNASSQNNNAFSRSDRDDISQGERRGTVGQKPFLDSEKKITQEQNKPLSLREQVEQSRNTKENQNTENFSDSEDLDKSLFEERPSFDFFKLNERVNNDTKFDEAISPFLDISFSDKFLNETSENINPVLEKKIKQNYYSNPIYKFLLTADIDAFIQRQPRSYSLTPLEEKTLFEKRLTLANYYDSLRYYSKLPFADDFQYFFNGSKSYADRIYNHQFKGTLKIIRRLFSMTLDVDQEKKSLTDKRLLKFDQPLYKKLKKIKNPLLHEELDIQKTRQTPFIEEINPIPFYAGWDDQLRKLVITNRLLPRQVATYSMTFQNDNAELLPFRSSFTSQREDKKQQSSNKIFEFNDEIENQSNSSFSSKKKNTIAKKSFFTSSSRHKEANVESKKLDFTAWPIPKFVLEKPENQTTIPYKILFQSLEDPESFNLKENLKSKLAVFDFEWDLETVPSSMKKNDSDTLVDILAPSRGGFIWPGHSFLKFNPRKL